MGDGRLGEVREIIGSERVTGFVGETGVKTKCRIVSHPCLTFCFRMSLLCHIKRVACHMVTHWGQGGARTGAADDRSGPVGMTDARAEKSGNTGECMGAIRWRGRPVGRLFLWPKTTFILFKTYHIVIIWYICREFTSNRNGKSNTCTP